MSGLGLGLRGGEGLAQRGPIVGDAVRIAFAVAGVREAEAEACAEASSVHAAVVAQRLVGERGAVPCGQRDAEGVAEEADHVATRWTGQVATPT